MEQLCKFNGYPLAIFTWIVSIIDRHFSERKTHTFLEMISENKARSVQTSFKMVYWGFISALRTNANGSRHRLVYQFRWRHWCHHFIYNILNNFLFTRGFISFLSCLEKIFPRFGFLLLYRRVNLDVCWRNKRMT